MSIKNFSEWGSLNEGVTPEQADKVFDEAEKWSKATGIKIEVDKEHIHDWMGTGHIYVFSLFGSWKLALEASSRKGSQDSMYRQTYNKDASNKKWYITFPGRWSQYNSRGRTKPGNLKTFKDLIEEFTEVKKVFDKISFFFKNALGIKEIDTTHYQNTEGKYVVQIDGENLKSLKAYSVGIFYKRGVGWTKDVHGNPLTINPSTVEILHQCLEPETVGTIKKSNKLRDDVEKTGKNYDEILEILEVLKDYPLDKFLEEMKTGDWESVKKKHIGKIGGSKYGL